MAYGNFLHSISEVFWDKKAKKKILPYNNVQLEKILEAKTTLFSEGVTVDEYMLGWTNGGGFILKKGMCMAYSYSR